MLILIGLLLILALTVATGYFVAQEFSYVAVDRNRLQALAEAGDGAAERALKVTSRLSFVLSGAQIGITVTALLAGYVAQPYLGAGLEELLGTAGLPRSVSLSVSVILALLLATIIQMVFGELAPKNLAIARAEAIALRLSRSTLMYLTVAGPLIHVFDSASNRILRRVGIEPVEELPQGATAQDLDRIIATSFEQGLLDQDTTRLLDRGLDFRDRIAGEVMVPRVDVITVHEDEPLSRVVELLDAGHSRFPVIAASVDEVVGVVAISDVVEVEPADRHHVTVGSLASSPVIVPFTLPLPVVLEQLRTAHRQLAIVVDEFGGFDGIVTLEDIAEELVGEIHDEDDLPEPDLVPNPEGSWTFPARWRIDQVDEALGISLPEDEYYDTVSGLVMARLGRIPVVGDEVVVELPQRFDHDGRPVPSERVSLRVETVVRHVPGLVRVERLS
ncbi:CBS domain containing-hemolysin-like protein [Kribbella orskensis]|uniref:CBS domain containing-hemolysin-like protein n=1 Tax=Kribbella orskensis TaxID=2512216 RepID=A0ABY2BUP1_9ACTN|nr:MULTISPECIES: hemolysin family protein [Kribbella]TCN44257.1 CBS domain containing-hemolysin-like protein [Kribbella sp. VKM Ac-2500]TCO31965.1 CBS domain containing-hemolysin-like protein [Kribbella orskensis]